MFVSLEGWNIIGVYGNLLTFVLFVFYWIRLDQVRRKDDIVTVKYVTLCKWNIGKRVTWQIK